MRQADRKVMVGVVAALVALSSWYMIVAYLQTPAIRISGYPVSKEDY